jgi:hypothetical protein
MYNKERLSNANNFSSINALSDSTIFNKESTSNGFSAETGLLIKKKAQINPKTNFLAFKKGLAIKELIDTKV